MNKLKLRRNRPAAPALCQCEVYPTAHVEAWCIEQKARAAAVDQSDLAFDLSLDIFRAEIGAM